jgi:hypothetical protein
MQMMGVHMKYIMTMMALCLASPSYAHMMWFDKEAKSELKIFYGEFDHHEKTGAVLDKLVPKVIAENRREPDISRRPDFIAVQGSGDMRASDERYLFSRKAERSCARSSSRAGAAIPLIPRWHSSSFPLVRTVTLVLTRDGKPVPDADVTRVLPADLAGKTKTDSAGRISIRPACAGGFCSKRLGSISRRGRSMAPPTTSRPWSPRLPSTGEMMAQASTPMKHSAPLPGAAFVALRGHVLAMERSFPAVGHGRTAPPPSVRSVFVAACRLRAG